MTETLESGIIGIESNIIEILSTAKLVEIIIFPIKSRTQRVPNFVSNLSV